MEYKEILKYIYEKLPMYHLIGDSAYKKDIGNITILCEHHGNPQQKFKSIHVAGTNGKGSVSHLLASVFSLCGYKTGLFTSPHLLDFRERIRINGKVISKKYVIDFVSKNKKLIEEVQPSFFEIATVMAFTYFADNQVDMAIIETGLGGRLDATNIIRPELAVITNISLEHEYMLGVTLEKIAFEKGGIIKENTTVLIGEKKPETIRVFENIAKERNAPLFFAEDCYNAEYKGSTDNIQSRFEITDLVNQRKFNLKCDLLGIYQGKNIVTVLKALDILKVKNNVLLDKSIINGIAFAKKKTGLRGRWEILSKSPIVVCDISHNPVAIRETIHQLGYYTFNKLHIVFGLSADKNLDLIFKELPVKAEYYFCKPSVPRGMEISRFEEKATEYGFYGRKYGSVIEAYQQAVKNSTDRDFILVTGSTFVVAEVLERDNTHY